MNFFSDIEFANKESAWWFVLIPILIIWYLYRIKKQEGELNISSTENISKSDESKIAKFRHLIFILRLLALSGIIIVLMRPQSRTSWKDIKTEGIDIVISLDVSYSMMAKDFDPNRIESAKKVITDFINARQNDRIGLVVFGGEAFTQCPLTTDHKVIQNMFKEIKCGMLEQGTAIGLGLANAVAKLVQSKAKSKVVILVTDGVSNVGEIAPLTAADIAKTYGVRVYTIGVGKRGKALMPVQIYPNGQMEYDWQDVDLDEETMTKIANATGGKYFRATDNKSLSRT
jgi:Ca-activated chloride channel homolog